MSWSYVQGTGAALTSAGTSLSATLSGVTAGNMLVLGVTAEASGSSSPVLTVGDGSNTYTVANSLGRAYGSDAVTVALYSSIVGTSGSLTFTVTSSISGLISFSVDEWVPAGANPGVDATGTWSPSLGTSGASVAMTTNGPDLVVACWDVVQTNLTYTAGSGWTLGYTQSGASSRPYASAYGAPKGPGSEQPSVNWGIQLAKATGVGAAWSSSVIATGWRAGTLKPTALSLLQQYLRLY
jgi:hypothetical protein